MRDLHFTYFLREGCTIFEQRKVFEKMSFCKTSEKGLTKIILIDFRPTYLKLPCFPPIKSDADSTCW